MSTDVIDCVEIGRLFSGLGKKENNAVCDLKLDGKQWHSLSSRDTVKPAEGSAAWSISWG